MGCELAADNGINRETGQKDTERKSKTVENPVEKMFPIGCVFAHRGLLFEVNKTPQPFGIQIAGLPQPALFFVILQGTRV